MNARAEVNTLFRIHLYGDDRSTLDVAASSAVEAKKQAEKLGYHAAQIRKIKVVREVAR